MLRNGGFPRGLALAASLAVSSVATALHDDDVERSKRCEIFLSEGIGSHTGDLTTDNPLVRHHFKQGLSLSYAFNHPEAARSFRLAIQEDPECAMCYWGLALVLGPNINMPMSNEDGRLAYEAVQAAVRLKDNVSERERAYIEALATRYAADPATADRQALDVAYAEAMGQVAAHFPDDLEAQVLYAEALMDVSPWNYWNADGTPNERTLAIMQALEKTLAAKPDHAGANHFYIHLMELPRPAQGIAAATRLAGLAPRMGHLVHMPAHIWVRTGSYDKATKANLDAIEADDEYLDRCDPPGHAYKSMYVLHNFDFLTFAALMEGRSALALDTARELSEMVDHHMLSTPGMEFQQQWLIAPALIELQFGRYASVLTHEVPADDQPFGKGLLHFARGMALAKTGSLEQAEVELKALEKAKEAPQLANAMIMGVNRATDILSVAEQALAGQIALSRGEHDLAIKKLEAAVATQEGLTYMEPPAWYPSTRLLLGEALLAAGKAVEAEKVYERDLVDYPENGWTLHGLHRSLVAQGRDADAQKVKERFQAAWKNADHTITP